MNEFESILVRSIKLKSLIQSEERQKEKNKYHVLTHIYGIRKSTAEPICRAAMETQTWRKTYGLGKKGEGGADGQSNMETYTLLLLLLSHFSHV